MNCKLLRSGGVYGDRDHLSGFLRKRILERATFFNLRAVASELVTRVTAGCRYRLTPINGADEIKTILALNDGTDLACILQTEPGFEHGLIEMIPGRIGFEPAKIPAPVSGGVVVGVSNCQTAKPDSVSR